MLKVINKIAFFLNLFLFYCYYKLFQTIFDKTGLESAFLF